MNTSKEVTMAILETLIVRLESLSECKQNCSLCLELEAEIKCFQHHLKGFEK